MHREARAENYLLAVFTTASLIMLFLPLSGPVESVKAALTYVFHPMAYTGTLAADRFAKAPMHMRGLISADIKNRELSGEIRKTLLLRVESKSLRLENARLRRILGLKGRPRRSSLWARVMARDALHWHHGFMVDAGKDMGVEVNSPVLGRQGDSLVLVGRVAEVGPASAKVLLVTDELFSVAAYVGPQRLEGLIQGQGAEGLRMNYLPSESVVEEGQTVQVSPTSATFPPDILIGVVTKVTPTDAFLTFPSVEIKPAIEGSSLSEVMILKSIAPDEPGEPVEQDEEEGSRRGAPHSTP